MFQKCEKYQRFDQFEVSQDGGIVHVEISRPKSYNSFDSKTWGQYRDLFKELENDDSVKVIVLSGEGKHFCSGLDLKSSIKEFNGIGSSREKLHRHILEFQEAISVTAEITKPTIALLHGLCLGLALDLVAPMAIRLVTQDAKLSIREIAIGIVADIGSLQRLPAVVNNKSRLNELALTGEFWSLKDAAELGFVSHVLEDKLKGLESAFKIAFKISAHEDWCIRGTKASISMMNEMGVKDGLNHVADYNADHIDTAKLSKTLGRILKL